jgi:phosphoenolpyruvate carboxykinase (ATP)
MLTADAFGVMPPIVKLTAAEAMFHFLSGYTAKVAGTEKGVVEPEATFSTCFGAPFMPRQPSVYGDLLRSLIAKHNVNCWLVNTGWTGGKYGVGQRMPIKVTRTLLTAALDGTLNDGEFYIDKHFGFQVPASVKGVDSRILKPRETWSDKELGPLDILMRHLPCRHGSPASRHRISESAAGSSRRPINPRQAKTPDRRDDLVRRRRS